MFWTNNKPIIPFTKIAEKKKGKGFTHKNKEFIHHSSLHHSETAFFRLNAEQKIVILFAILVLSIDFIIDWHTTVLYLVGLLTFLYFTDLLFNFFLIFRSFLKTPAIEIKKSDIYRNKKWPSYTIFCPLYKEWKVIPQFIEAMSDLDYPQKKLQVMLLLEQDDVETIRKVKSMYLPAYFEVVIVPDSLPKTKPKALNYGLKKAKGDYVVVYDAEDVPEADQLKKIVLAFKKVSKRVVCIQAKLNFYNPRQNVITRIFTAEYALWFDLVLTGLQSIHAPIPLGGTSNHFKTSDVKTLKGWDSFNVTEDADLGMRLVKHGYLTAIVDSTTYEEANSDGVNWFWQRSRWVKGYMQTYLVHMRKPQDFFTHWKEPHAITFQLVVGGKILSMFINPFMWIITISYFVFRPIVGPSIESFYPAPILYMGLFSLVIGNFLYMYYYMIGCAKRDYHDIIKYAFLVPFYWLFMSIAAWTSVYLLIKNPHHWSKTKHGLHLKETKKITARISPSPTF